MKSSFISIRLYIVLFRVCVCVFLFPLQMDIPCAGDICSVPGLSSCFFRCMCFCFMVFWSFLAISAGTKFNLKWHERRCDFVAQATTQLICRDLAMCRLLSFKMKNSDHSDSRPIRPITLTAIEIDAENRKRMNKKKRYNSSTIRIQCVCERI